MKTKQALKYQLHLTMKSLAIFFLFYTLAMVAVVILVTFFGGEGAEQEQIISSGDGAAIFFMLVMGIVAYRETLRFMIQHGVSRKETMLASVANSAICAATISIANVLLNMLFSAIQGDMIFRNVSELIYAYSAEVVTLQIIYGMFFTFLACMMFYFIGVFITLGYYHLGRRGKYIVSIGVPMIVIVVLPALNRFVLNGAIANVFIKWAHWVVLAPMNLVITYIVIAAAALVFAVMLNRRINVSGGSTK